MHSSTSLLEECCTRSSNLKPIITVPKVNLAIRTASSCSRSSSGPPSPRWSTSCWLGPAAPLLRAAPFAFLRCVFCCVVFPLSLVFKNNTILLCHAWCVWYPESKSATSISSLSDLMLPLGYNGDTRLGQKKVGSRCWQQSLLTWYKFSTLVSNFYEIFV